MNRADLASKIDHTLLRPDATSEDIRAICNEALEVSCASVCVNGVWISEVAAILKGSPVMTAGVAGFPLGAMSAVAKAMEAAQLVRDGVQEIDMVMNVGALIEGDHERVLEDIRAVVTAAESAAVKVILETCLLDNEQKVTASRIVVEAGAAFVKTSTGFSSGGATVEDVRLLRKTVGETAQVKASGGIRDTRTALAMLEAGADRLGMSATRAVLDGLES